MKKLLCLFAVIALAAPIYAADPNVHITCTDEGGGTVRIDYEVKVEDGVDPGLARGFAMDITVSGNATIEGISDYSNDGTATSTPSEYGVFISSIDFGSDPNNVDDWGDPVASGTGALGGLTTNGITVEIASLYNATTEAAKAPGMSGTLFKIQIAGNGDATTNVSIAAEALRGGAVMEDVASANIVAPGCTADFTLCFVQSATGPAITQDMIDDWEAWGRPDCWCWARQCYGDTNNDKQGSTRLGWQYVGSADIDLIAAAWQILEPPKGSGIAGRSLNGIDFICADVNHAQQGSTRLGWQRVGSADIGVLSANWQVLEPPKGSGVPADCVANPVP
jgi:hypothetical protein